MADGGVDDFSYQAIGGLVYIADEYWYQIDGACARAGVDPLSLPLERFLSLVYSWVMERMAYSDEEDRKAFDDALFSPTSRSRGRDSDNVAPEVVEEEMSLFQSFTSWNDTVARGA